MIKFNRNYILELESNEGDIIQIKYPLTLEFSIIRNNLASANTGTFNIYNLSELTRNRIYKNRKDGYFRTIKLMAGYGEDLAVIFNGNINEASSFRGEGSTNFITKIEGYDMSFAMVQSYSNWTLEGSTTKDKVIDSLVNDLSGYNVTKGIVSSFEGNYPRGFTAMKNTWSLLQEVTDNHAYIDNGKLYALKENDTFEGDITEISSKSGLLGSPKLYDVYMNLEMVFEPKLLVGQLVKIDSRTMSNFIEHNLKIKNSEFQVTGIQHSGVISGTQNGKCKTIVSVAIGDAAFANLYQ